LGSDTNPCSRTAACRTLQHAHDMTNAGGEIDVLDTAGYGALTINKAISIVNDGSTASVLVPSGGIGITISSGASDAVSLRGLTIEGAGTGATGIQFNTGKSLTVDNCVIRHVTSEGLAFSPNATSDLAVSNTLASDNGDTGILVFPTGSGTVTANFNRVKANNNSFHGIAVDGDNSTGTINATVSDSVVTHNGLRGFLAGSTAGQALVTLTVFRSVAANNETGLMATGAGAILRASESIVTGSNFGWLATNSGVLLSAGDNTIEGNTNFQGAPTTYTKK